MKSSTTYTVPSPAVPGTLSGSLAGLLLLTAVILVLAATASATDRSSARCVAMGGAYIGLAKGVEAGLYNPANLGLAAYRQTGLALVGVGADLSNNSFTLNDYNEYTGAFLTDDDKNDILGKIPDEGLKMKARADATAMSVSNGPFAFTISGVGIAEVNLNKDVVDLMFNGNTMADTIDITGSYSDAMSYASAGLSYGFPIYTKGQRQLAVGATAKYIKGIAIEQVVELQGLAATNITGFSGEGRVIAQTAEGGSGYGIDVGATLRLNDSYTVGATITNLLGSITWDNNPKEYGYIFSFDTTNLDNMEEDFVTSDDYDIAIEDFSTTLPQILTIGVAKTKGTVKWAVDWQQGLVNKPGASTKPRLSLGGEWAPIGVLPVRMGYSAGGDHNAGFSFGTGVHLWPVQFDIAAVSGTSLSGYSAKGANVAVSLGIHF